MSEMWEIIGYFKYNNLDYVMTINKKCRKFFFKVSDQGYDYLTMMEYIDLLKKYNTLKIIKSNRKKFIEKLPLIKIRNKLVPAVIVLTMMLSITGCSSIKSTEEAINQLQDDGVIVECKNDELDIYQLNSITFEKMKNYKSCGVSFEGYSEAPFIDYCAPCDMKNYINKDNITWKEIRETLNKNSFIDQNIKELLLEGINNLEIANFNMDLSVLYYNIKNLNIEYSNEMSENAGYFDHVSCTAVLSDNLQGYELKEIVLHEILGHGMTRAYLQENNGIFFDIVSPYLQINDNGIIDGTGNLGYFSMEGIADLITSIATGDKLKTSKASYTTEAYSLCTLCSSLGIELHEFANKGINFLIDKMQKKGISNPYNIIMKLDSQTELFTSNELYKCNNTELFIKYYEELISLGDTENLKESCSSYKQYVDTENVNGLNMIIRISSEDCFYVVQPDTIEQAVYSIIEKNNQERD